MNNIIKKGFVYGSLALVTTAAVIVVYGWLRLFGVL